MKVYEQKKYCSGCGACADICAKKAITLEPDEYGFYYPVVNEEECVSCGLCKKVCGFYKEYNGQACINAVAIAASNKDTLLHSASGGAFYIIAKTFIQNGGMVFGSAMEVVDGSLEVKHIGVDRVENLWKLQGSKYVQSKTEGCFRDIKKLLKNGTTILFSGTPCQVANLYSYLDGRNLERLYTIDIICHGVPSNTYFNEYIKELEKKHNGKVLNFWFRDKTRGWGLNAKYIVRNNKGNIKKFVISSGCSSYYHYFLNSEIYRESCYSCRYASSNRVGDITLGDFWGFEDMHPEQLKANGGEFEEKYGVSCALINSAKGKLLYRDSLKQLKSCDTNFEMIAKNNHQLKECSRYSGNREVLLELYKKFGYVGIEKKYKKDLGLKYYMIQIKNKYINLFSCFKFDNKRGMKK